MGQRSKGKRAALVGVGFLVAVSDAFHCPASSLARLRSQTIVRMTQESPPAKLELPKVK